MAPSGFKCGKCDKPFYGRQKRLPCKGPCTALFHLDCVSIKDDDFDLLMVNGQSSYLCDLCSRLPRNDGTPIAPCSNARLNVKGLSGRSLMISSADEEDVLSNDVVMTKCWCKNLVPKLFSLISNLETKIDVMAGELVSANDKIEELISRNLLLSDKVATLADEVSSSNSSPALSSPTYSGVAKKNVEKNKSNKKKSLDPLSSKSKSLPIPPESDKSIGIPHFSEGDNEINASEKNISLVEEVKSHAVVRQDEWRFVDSGRGARNKGLPKQPKNKRKAVVGSRTEQMHFVKPRKRALFVTRFEQSASAKDVSALIKGALFDVDVSCTKLVTKRDGYSSFHILINEEDYNRINSPEVWPKGILVLPFYGKLSVKQIFQDDIKENKTLEEGKIPSQDEP